LPTSDLSEIDNANSNDNALLVSITPLNDPVSRGDTQSVTITVTDSTSDAVANAEIDGNLIYPGDNFEKDFNGITDSRGEFVYSWTIGENGDAGPLSVQVEVSDQVHPPASATSSFDIVDISGE
jgi:phosphatidate phosphatase APP1